MHKFVKYLALFFVGLVMFPATMQAVHELTEHHDEKHCNDGKVHFCEKHESCAVCSFVFSPSVTSETHHFVLENSPVVVDRVAAFGQFTATSSLVLYFTLRGPPTV